MIYLKLLIFVFFLFIMLPLMCSMMSSYFHYIHWIISDDLQNYFYNQYLTRRFIIKSISVHYPLEFVSIQTSVFRCQFIQSHLHWHSNSSHKVQKGFSVKFHRMTFQMISTELTRISFKGYFYDKNRSEYPSEGISMMRIHTNIIQFEDVLFIALRPSMRSALLYNS